MHHIPTSSAAVSKLKKAAKLLSRQRGNLAHAEALDLVAANAGYAHWKHVTTCAAACDASLSGAHGIPIPFDQSLTFISGVSGAGKSRRAADMARYWLQHAKPVHVIDLGHSYLQLCKTAGGTFTTFNSQGTRNEQRFGEAALTVFELWNHVPLFPLWPSSPLSASPEPSPLSIPISEISPSALLIVDEHPYVANLLGGHGNLERLVSSHMASGGSAVIVTQQALSSPDMLCHLPKSLVGRITPTVLSMAHF